MNTLMIFRACLFLLCLATVARAQSNGAVKATTTLHPDGTQTVTVVDPEKRTAEETLQDAGGKPLRKVTYLLDDANQPLGSITHDAKGNVQFRSAYRRDPQGRIDEETVSTAEGQTLRRRIYTYGPQNKVIRVDEYDPQGNLLTPAKRSSTNQSAGKPDKKRR